MPTKKSSGQLSTGIKTHGKPWLCCRRRKQKSVVPGHTGWDRGLPGFHGFQAGGFNPCVCFWSTLWPLSCPCSSHSSGEDGPCPKAKQLMALAHCKQPPTVRERKYLTLGHITRREKNQQQTIPSSTSLSFPPFSRNLFRFLLTGNQPICLTYTYSGSNSLSQSFT